MVGNNLLIQCQMWLYDAAMMRADKVVHESNQEEVEM